MSEYIYPDLTTDLSRQPIRLIELYPGSKEEPLTIRLYEVALPDEPEYETISYCWGDSSKPRTINCHGAILHITESLYRALLGFRYPKKPRILWADAVCINQDNTAEKNVQVAMMGKIYESCVRVLIWLGYQPGNEDDYVYLCTGTIKMLLESRRLKLEDNDTREIWELDSTARKRYNLPSIYEVLSARYWEVAQLLRAPYLPWFRRVWIIQELALAPEAHLCYGRLEVSWEDFFAAWNYVLVELGWRTFVVVQFDTKIWGSVYFQQFSSMLDADDSRIVSLMYSLNHIRQVMKSSREDTQTQNIRPKLSILLRRYQTSKATHPRDKIFALLGLISPEEREALNIDIDYGRLPTLDLYRDVAFKIQWLDQSLDIFDAGIVQIDGWPSWVPDWTKARTGKFATPISQFSATPGTICRPRQSPNHEAIVLCGHILDQIFSVGIESVEFQPKCVFYTDIWTAMRYFWLQCLSAWNRDWTFVDWYILILSNVARLQRNAESRGEGIATIFRQTAIMYATGNQVEDVKSPIDIWADRAFPLFGWLVKRVGVMAVQLTVFKIFLCLFVLMLEVWHWRAGWSPPSADGRRMVVTNSGLLGLASAETQVGDLIALFHGGKVPLIVRMKGTQYQLIGDCYVHGAMYGSAFKQEECQDMWLV
jgi:hypothetical protein